MPATNEQIQQAVESFFLLFNGVVVFRKSHGTEINAYEFASLPPSDELRLHAHRVRRCAQSKRRS